MPKKPKKSLFDDLMEAVTFAEAGEAEHARELAAEAFGLDRAGHILAISPAPRFSTELVEAALGVAERLRYGLVALSVPPGARGLVTLLGGRHQGAPTEWCSPEEFRDRAARRGIPLLLAARSGAPEEAAAELSRRVRRIAFLLVDPRQLQADRFDALGLPVFALGDV